jgi:hypothetical protein
MRNPTRKQVDFVIKKLKLVREQASREDAFNMNEERVYDKESEYKCGTVHCVGGWYAVANLNRKEIKDEFNQGRVSFVNGAELMAQDLGFRCNYDLQNWAEVNPEIWGNEKGFEMLSKERAYDNPGFDGVIAQFETVRDNLPETA